jgi:hypothetical protein
LEYQCEESDERYLRINGMKIPPADSDDEKLWKEKDDAVPYGPYLSK